MEERVETTDSAWLSRSIMAGFCATVVMLVLAIISWSLSQMLSQLPMEGSAWLSRLANNPVTNTAHNFMYAALSFHLLVGLFWAIVYARFAEPRLQGPGWLRGVKFSILPWILSVIIFLPLMGGGLLGLRLGAGPLPILGNLILHLAFGATLGVLYGSLADRIVERLGDTAAEAALLQHTHGMGARGLLLGLLFGFVVATAGVTMVSVENFYRILGLPEAWFMLSVTLMGGALGMLIGLLVGLPTSPRSHPGARA